MTSFAQRRINFGYDVMKKFRVYLDTKFWVYLRDAHLGSPANPSHSELYRVLLDRVVQGSLVCPIEQHVFLEAYKQGNIEKRLAVTRVIDQLSQGATLLSQPNRMFMEVREFVQASLSGPQFPEAPAHKMWTRVAYILGHGGLTSSTMDANDLRHLNELMQETLWNFDLEDMIHELGPSFPMPDSRGVSTAELLNRNKLDPDKRFPSRRNLYLSEVRGIFDAFAGTLGDVMELFYRELVGAVLGPDEQERNAAGARLAAMLGAAFEKHELSRQLPMAHILATLYAAVQWDVNRKYKPNDFPDFGHAAAALPYFDLFLTERSLATLVQQTGLAETYGTAIAADPEEAIACLRRSVAA